MPSSGEGGSDPVDWVNTGAAFPHNQESIIEPSSAAARNGCASAAHEANRMASSLVWDGSVELALFTMT